MAAASQPNTAWARRTAVVPQKPWLGYPRSRLVATVIETARCPLCGEVNRLLLSIKAGEYVLGGPGANVLPDTVVCTQCKAALRVRVKEASDGVGGCLACRWVELCPRTAVDCPECGGSGNLTAGRHRPHPGHPCPRCSGRGWLPA